MAALGKVTLKGGGDAASAARAVMETGEFDYAWNQQLAPDIIKSMEASGKGRFISEFGPTVERLVLNHSNPDPSLGPDERSIIKPHPFLQDPAIYKAMSMAIVVEWYRFKTWRLERSGLVAAGSSEASRWWRRFGWMDVDGFFVWYWRYGWHWECGWRLPI